MPTTILRYPFLVVTLITVALLVWVLATFDQGTDAAREMTRLTARTSAIIFLLVFSASSWHRLAPGEWSRALLKQRRRLGLSMAYSHTIHLCCFVALFWISGTKPNITTLVVGGGAYVAMYAMAFTSNDGAVQRLGARRWKLLHRFGIYYLWLVFFATYSARLTASLTAVNASQRGRTVVADVIGMVLLLVVLILRIPSLARRRSITDAAGA